MRIFNFLLIFLLCLALVLFSIENAEITSIQIIQGVEFQAPLSVELIIAMGLGAALGLIFSLWSRMQGMLLLRGKNSQVRQKEKRIEELEKKIERYQEEQTEKLPLLPESKSVNNGQ